MMLRAGTPSVPSSAIGKVTSPPAVASSVAGDERTGEGTADSAAGPELSLGGCVVSLDQGALMAPSQNIAPRVRFGISATKMRPATSVRIPDKKARNGVSSRWSAKCSGIHASVGFSSVWKWFFVPTLTCVTEQIASAIKDRVALDDTMLLAGPSLS